jgi:DNA polymerase III delta subunit
VIVVDQAHLLKEVESIQEILGERRSLDETSSCVVFLSKDLDGRKKSSKILTESAAVIACDEVTEEEREPWIHYLAKRADLIWAKDAELAPVWRQLVDRLRLLEPWSLEMIDSEIAKLSLCEPGSAVNPQDLLSGQTSQDTQAFIEAFLKKDRTRALSALASFADRPEEVFPLLGLLAWNVRHLAVLLKDRESRTRSIKLSPFLAERLEKTADRWKLKEALLIQERLLDMDFSFKQTQRMPLGVWSDFVITCLA